MTFKERWHDQYNKCYRQWDDICHSMGERILCGGLLVWGVYGLYQLIYCPAFRGPNPPATFWNMNP